MTAPNTDPSRHRAHDAARSVATEIVRTLADAGHVAYFAGGCVRDDLLGLDPTDYDVATDATPDRVQELFGRTSAVGAHFGVVLVHDERLPRGESVEVATFRSDGNYSDNRRPDEVTFSSPEEDAARRDFTINALFSDPLKQGSVEEQVIDFVGGVADLRDGVVRAVGIAEDRLREDHLRALRAVRFAGRLGFRIDEDTAQAIRAHARMLEGVSRERVGEEMRKIMGDTYRSVAVWQLQYLGLDEPVFGDAKERALPRTLGRLPDDADLATCLAAVALDRGLIELTQVAPLVADWRERLCLSNAERDRLKDVLEGLALIEREWEDMSIAKRKRAASSSWFTEALRLVSTRDLERFVRTRLEVEVLVDTFGGLAPEPLISGDDLVKQGFQPGPSFGDVLERVYDAQLEGQVAHREQALELAARLLGEMGS